MARSPAKATSKGGERQGEFRWSPRPFLRPQLSRATDSVTATKAAHQQHIRQRVAQLTTDPAFFKKVYRYTFVAGKEGEQRALALDNAIEFWRVLFAPPGRPWRTASHDWLDLWTTFLGEKWTRTVNRDMWNQLLEFATRTFDDETLSFWSEDGAWPSVIDEFVAWCRGRGIGAGASGAGAMDTDV